MPLDSSGNYQAPSASGYFPGDLYNLGAAPAKSFNQSIKPKFSAKVIDKIPGKGEIVAWKVTYEDTRGGLNRIVGMYDEDYDRVASSTLDTRFYKSLILPQLQTSNSTPTPSGTFYGLHNVNAFGLLHVGMGSGANVALLKETSATNPALAAVTFSPGSSITSMSNIAVGSNKANQRLAVGMLSNVVTLFDAAYATTTMHADTAGCYGIIQTFINNNQLLIYSGNAIRYLDSSVAVGTQPTVGLNNVPNGGYALGLCKLAGTPIRAYWNWPYFDATGPLFATQNPGHIISTNIEGTDYQEIPLGIKNVYSAVIVNSSAICATDTQRVVYYDGRTQPRELLWIGARNPATNQAGVAYACVGLGVNGNEIIVDSVKTLTTATAFDTFTVSYSRHLESYNIETNSWHQISKDMSAQAVIPTPQLAIGDNTGFLHARVTAVGGASATWERNFLPVYGYNPFFLGNGNTAFAIISGTEYEASGTTLLPAVDFQGLEGMPKMVSKIRFHGNVDAGGTAATAAYVTITAGNMAATFTTGFAGRAEVADLVDNGDVFYLLQPQIDMARTTASTRFTPNALPFTIEGYAWVSELDAPFGYYEDPA